MVRSRFAAQMELLNTELIVMGTLCENALEHVMQALQEDNDALNREIIILGKRTEEKEREVENICINLLLKQQPVASDLRQISAALKMITDLSRIGEQAGNIAEILGKAEFGRDYDTTLLQQVGIHTAHGLTLRRQHEGLCRLRLLLLCRRVTPAQIVAEEQRHGVRVAESIELLDEADGSAALFGGVIEPLAAADGDAVVAGKAFVPAGCDELFSSAAEELLQVHRRGSFFLLGCKRNVL